nr:MAG TPA: hypothetical protein [Caudoviricetes sp.]
MPLTTPTPDLRLGVIGPPELVSSGSPVHPTQSGGVCSS